MNLFQRIVTYPARVICEWGYVVESAMFDKRRSVSDRIMNVPVLIVVGFLYGLLTSTLMQFAVEGQSFEWNYEPVNAMSFGAVIVFGPWLMLRLAMHFKKQ